MALSIQPGYDFQPTEVPTRQKFLDAALGLDITGIPLDRIQGTIQAIVFGNVTGASGGFPPAQGFLWVDPAGNRYSRWEPGGVLRQFVRTWHAQGGWETVRYLTRGFTAGFAIGYGLHMWHLGGYQVGEVRQDMDLDFSPWGATMHSVDSPASNARIIGRGLFTAWVDTQVTEVHLRTRRPGILTDVAGQFGWRVLNQFDGTKPHFAGTVLGPGPGSTGTTNTAPEAAAWFVMRNLGKS